LTYSRKGQIPAAKQRGKSVKKKKCALNSCNPAEGKREKYLQHSNQGKKQGREIKKNFSEQKGGKTGNLKTKKNSSAYEARKSVCQHCGYYSRSIELEANRSKTRKKNKNISGKNQERLAPERLLPDLEKTHDIWGEWEKGRAQRFKHWCGTRRRKLENPGSKPTFQCRWCKSAEKGGKKARGGMGAGGENLS